MTIVTSRKLIDPCQDQK